MSGEVDVARAAVVRGSEVALEYARAGVRAEWKAVGDVVTAADRAVQSTITEVIAAAYPDDVVVGEEGGPPPSEATLAGVRRWYVDPIDGTSNFLKGRHWWGVSVGFCAADDVLTAGAIALPVLGELFSATRGGGALRNDEPVTCSAVTDFAEALCTSGFPGAAALAEHSEANLEAWRAVLRRALSVRATGAIAPDWCDVACGRSEGSWTRTVGRWDIAAATVIAREAGAVVTDLTGTPITGPAASGLAAAPGIHAELLALVTGP